MSATDELRRLLDERGVEWRYKDERTTYWYGTLDGKEWGEWTAIEMGDYLHLTFSANGDTVTPEEAIAATLSDAPHLPYFWTADGTLHIELPKLPESISVRLPEQRDREVSSARVWQYTRGSGTCNMEYCDEWSGDELYPTEAYVCSACSYVTVDGTPNYCPNCGRKVVDG